VDEKFWKSINALHWIAIFVDLSFKNMVFLSQVKTADVTFKRNLLIDLDKWILAEISTVAANIHARATIRYAFKPQGMLYVIIMS
jgi:hypothetical protein